MQNSPCNGPTALDVELGIGRSGHWRLLCGLYNKISFPGSADRCSGTYLGNEPGLQRQLKDNGKKKYQEKVKKKIKGIIGEVVL